MTHHQEESLDETIDRVAAHLTMVPADPALASRIADRLETKALGWPRFALAAAAVIGMAILAVVVSNTVRHVPAVDVARATSSAPAPRVEPQFAVPATAESTTVIASQRVVRQRRAPLPTHDPLPELPQIDALSTPVLLAVDTLPTDTLTIEPVDLAPLGMADLSVAEIDGRDSPKE
jgi:hypothetical protein